MREIEKEVTMKKNLSDTSVALGLLLLIVLFVIATASARAGTVEERIEALEKKQMADQAELARLKKEQMASKEELARLRGKQTQLGQDALAAREARPTFKYRPGSGLRLSAADKDWELRFFGRLMLYNTFWLDENRPKRGAVQGAIHVRRFRPGFNFFWQKGFYEAKFQIDTANAGSSGGGALNAFDAEMVLHFEKLNPWLPFLHVGNSPSARLNPQDTNCSSKRCGRSERSMVNEGSGTTTGSVGRGLVLGWRRIPLWGPAQISFFNVGYGIDRFSEFNQGVGFFENDSKSFTAGIGIKPFAKSKNKWLKGMEFSFGTLIQKLALSGDRDLELRTNQTRFQRVDLVEAQSEEGQTQYYTPGFGWKYGPYQLRVSGQFYNAHRFKGRGDKGSLIKGRGIRIMHELFLWSPNDGFLTGSYKKGGLMIAPLFERASIRAPNGMNGCNDTVAGTGCQGAYAVNAGIGLWYYLPKDVYNFGLVWDHYRVNKADNDVADHIEKGTRGRRVNFNTLTFVSRLHW